MCAERLIRDGELLVRTDSSEPWELVDPGVAKTVHKSVESYTEAELETLLATCVSCDCAIYGSRVRLWSDGARWCVSTNTIADATRAHWCLPTSLGDQLLALLSETDLSTLNPDNVYHFIVRYTDTRQGIVQPEAPPLALVDVWSRTTRLWVHLQTADPVPTVDQLQRLRETRNGYFFRLSNNERLLVTSQQTRRFFELRGRNQNILKQYLWSRKHISDAAADWILMYPHYSHEFLRCEEFLFDTARRTMGARGLTELPRVLRRYWNRLRNMQNETEVHHFLLRNVPLWVQWRLLMRRVRGFTCITYHGNA